MTRRLFSCALQGVSLWLIGEVVKGMVLVALIAAGLILIGPSDGNETRGDQHGYVQN